VATLEGKSGLLRVTAYILPAASRDTARRAWETPSCYWIPDVLTRMSRGRALASDVLPDDACELLAHGHGSLPREHHDELDGVFKLKGEDSRLGGVPVAADSEGPG
jgi:hypothetical protein